MLTYFSDDDEAVARDVAIELKNIETPVTAEYYIQDAANDYALVRTEKITADNFTVQLHMDVFTMYLIKLIK